MDKKEFEKGDILFDLFRDMSVTNIKKVLSQAIDEVRLKAKKEVFDDIDELIDIDHPLNEVYIKLKERHLSTFQKKSDIIADKSKSAKIDITKNIVAD